MNENGFVERFQDLIVYREARELSRQIFEISKTFPKEERYALTDQIRRSTRSIGAQIAEAWGKRRYERHFISKLTDTDAEQLETQHWLLTALDCECMSREKYKELMQKSIGIGKMLWGMQGKASQFCNSSSNVLRETSLEYFMKEATDY